MANHVPHQFVVHAEVVVNQSISHARHTPPVNLGMATAEVRGNLLGGLANDLEAAYEGAAQRRVVDERRELDVRTSRDEVIRLYEDVPKEITRLEGHPALPPGSGGQ
jgi:uncharacterized OB-fold protein